MVLMEVVSLEALLHRTRHEQRHRECEVKPNVIKSKKKVIRNVNTQNMLVKPFPPNDNQSNSLMEHTQKSK